MKNASQQTLVWVLSALIHLEPFQVMRSGDFGFSWITGILGSGYREDEKYRMASQAVQLLWLYLCSRDPAYPLDIQSAWIPPLMKLPAMYESSRPPHSVNQPGIYSYLDGDFTHPHFGTIVNPHSLAHFGSEGLLYFRDRVVLPTDGEYPGRGP